MNLDSVLDKLEDITQDCPKPMLREHCAYCSAWLVIIEDILGNGESE
jgi:hypothetical protein